MPPTPDFMKPKPKSTGGERKNGAAGIHIPFFARVIEGAVEGDVHHKPASGVKPPPALNQSGISSAWCLPAPQAKSRAGSAAQKHAKTKARHKFFIRTLLSWRALF
jgi:hypothetical protein